MKRHKLATIATVVVAIPVGLLVLGYVALVLSPTGMEEARQKVSRDLEVVAALPARTPPAAPKAPTPAAVNPAPATKAIDYGTACELAAAAFPREETVIPSLTSVLGPRAGCARTGMQRFEPLPDAPTLQQWLAALGPLDDMLPELEGRGELGIPLDPKTAEDISRGGAGLDSVFVKLDSTRLQRWLDEVEPLVYEQDWQLPPYAENWPAAYGNGALALATGAQVALLRAAARGDADRVARYLPRCVDVSLDTRLALFNRSQLNMISNTVRLEDGRSLSRTLTLVSSLVDLPEASWEDVAARVDAAQLTEEQSAAMRSAFVIRQAEGLKRRIDKMERTPTQLHYLWDGRLQGVVARAMAPALRNRIDAFSAGLLTGTGFQGELDALHAAAKMAQVNERLEAYLEMSPTTLLYRGDHANFGNEWDQVTVATIRYRARHGRMPASFEAMVPEFIAGDFPERSRAAWLVMRHGDATLLAQVSLFGGTAEFWRTPAHPPRARKRRVDIIADGMFFPRPEERAGIARYLTGS